MRIEEDRRYVLCTPRNPSPELKKNGRIAQSGELEMREEERETTSLINRYSLELPSILGFNYECIKDCKPPSRYVLANDWPVIES